MRITPFLYATFESIVRPNSREKTTNVHSLTRLRTGIGGFAGVLYKPVFFRSLDELESGVFDKYPEGSFVDDDYISGMLENTEKFAVAGTLETAYAQNPEQATNSNSLSSGENKESNIDRQEKLLTRFVREGKLVPVRPR